MIQPWAALSRLTYPGRLIVIGQDPSGESNVVLYAITGRSASSQARKLVAESDAIWTRPTDPGLLNTGNPDLLVYPAISFGRGVVVSNGKQTADIDAGRPDRSPVRILDEGLRAWSFEPDAPIYTPRISGCVLPTRIAGLSILRRAAGGGTLRFFSEFPLESGRGRMIATYAGVNADLLPSFSGEPVDLEIGETSARGVAEAVYDALGPRDGDKDLRVAVACVFARVADMADRRHSIINRAERTGG